MRQTARFALREATAPWHEQVDTIFSATDLTDRAGYGRFLCAQAAAHVPVERGLDAGGIEDVLPDWAGRRRAHLIAEDLSALDLSLPALEPKPDFASVAAMLGAVYVLEGSRLGGTLLRRTIPANFPAAFLSGGTKTAWRDLISFLDLRLITRNDLDEAIESATAVFVLFERSGRHFL